MNKKLVASLLCSTFLFGLSACGSHDTSSSNTKNEQETSKETKNDELSDKDPQKEFPTSGNSSDVYISIGPVDSLDVIGNGEVQAQGVFKVLDVRVHNDKEEPITLHSDNFTLIDGTGREYHISNEYQLVLKAANTATFKFGVLNPHENSEGNIVFDVPKNTQGLTLKVSGDMLGKGIELKVE
ncbi:DUF4352 domain-containing protein [Bacillus cereus]|nr:hypothetical protein bcere0029_52900 [Bacillus cereus AH1272]EEL95084.1 hypothetical protein bcere0030_8370 [Bacillus cereus AH1273]PEW83408.1 DUF4352 domain-containing protein [Bacillus cereus]PFN77830.1 DUF4352 domain-containing protein [Bacillus cereus]GCF76578.1 long-chain-fatty-acid--CoA ligase [Bacillus cereus]